MVCTNRTTANETIHNSHKRNVLRGPWWLYGDVRTVPFASARTRRLQALKLTGISEQRGLPGGVSDR
jgi:hypothetical protein